MSGFTSTFCLLTRKLREHSRQSLRDVSAGTGLSISFLSDIEHERVTPSVESVIKILHHYGMTIQIVAPDDLVKGDANDD